jgi:molecular chaperone HscA
MLLQIAEPGESKVKEACRPRVAGIDLGTTNTLVAHVVDGSPVVLSGDGGALIPSVVHYGDGVVVGRAAAELAAEHPRDTIVSVKRFVGRGLADLASQRALLPYELAPEAAGGAQLVRFVVGPAHREVSPVEVSAEILREAARRAEAALGGPLQGVVITVPAYFDDAQRQATRDAGRLAGLEVLRLLAEPTAAALAYGLDRGARGLYAVYDLGGGTFDVSLLRLVDGVFEVRATGGDSALGGDDVDRALAARMLERAGVAVDLSTDAGASVEARKLARRALAAARAVKEDLTDADAATFRLALGPDHGGAVVERLLTRQELAEVMRPLLDRTARAVRRVLKDADVEAEALDGVILVGGSTRSPVVRAFVETLFGRPPLCDLDPDAVVALGAAVQAEALAGGEQQVVLVDVIPLSLGIETMGGVVEKLLHRNTTIPAGASQTFTTYADNQTGFELHVVQGERETVDACRSLARFTLRGVPPMVAGMARVEITFLVDADGILRVSAREQVSGQQASVEVKPSYGLTDDEIERMLLDSFDHAEDDLAARNLAVERVEAERILAATRAALGVDPELWDPETREATARAIAALERAHAGSDHLAIRAAVEALDIASKPFAQRRMDRAVAAAMQGRTLAEVEQEL